MCSSILGPKPIIIAMDKYEGGDLTDIFRASTTTTSTTSTCNSTTSVGVGVGVGVGVTSPSSPLIFSNYNPHHHHHSHVINNNSSSSSSNPNPKLVMNNNNNNNNQLCNSFGDPFSTMRDPFLHHLDFPPPPPAYFAAAAQDPLASAHQQLHLDDDVVPIIRPPSTNNNIFSNIIQISPRPKLPPPPPLDSSPATGITSNNMAPSSAASRDRDCLVDNAGVQISSPTNPSLKRRKSQAKKVVCIPAPAAANSRPSSGEVVPSDLWAWRKYGQKPIKGSPYPRGYYRCSSSKGCSARKQVERSRTDPNMLVITYTSEHNHPWPTQRNALAGSTRSQPSKNSNTNNASSIKTINNPPPDQAALIHPQSKPKEEEDQMRVKEETEDDSSDHHHKHIDQVEELDELENNNIMEDNDDNTTSYTYNHHHRQFSDAGGGLAYKPSMLECNIQSDQDFFADLGEIEADPLNLLFTPPAFNTDHHQHQHTESKASLDPFHLFDWSAPPDHTTTSTSSFEDEPKRGL